MVQPLTVSIVGCGIAGAFAARVLREHHNVTIFERFSRGNELGAAINIGPNAIRILEQYSFSKVKARSIPVKSTSMVAMDGTVLHRSELPDLPQRFGADWLFQHRTDLWHELMRLATAPSSELGISGEPATVRWGTEVIDVDVESGEITLADQTVVKSDLIIGADGIKSLLRGKIVGDAEYSTARPSGSSAFRFLIPRDVVEEVFPGMPLMDSSQGATLQICTSQDLPSRSVVMYPCREFELLNFGCIAPDSMIGVPTTESWSSVGTQEDLLRCFGDFTCVQPLLQRAENIKLWQLRDQDPLPTYIRGRAVIIGDAAHAMTPHQGQGGTQAIEDGEAFCLFSERDVRRETVGQILEDFDRVRRTRASKIQNITRKVQRNKTPEEMWRSFSYNFTYGGVHDSLAKLARGQEF